MARIAGVDLPREKRIEIGLTYIYGIGRVLSNKILAEAGVNPDTRVKDLTEAEINSLRSIIDNSYTVEGDLKREVSLDIKRLTEIGCYRGMRHRRGPVSYTHLDVYKRQILRRHKMSRIGRMPINIPASVEIKIDNGSVRVKGPKGELVQAISKDMIFDIQNGVLCVSRPSDDKEHKALHGLSLIHI